MIPSSVVEPFSTGNALQIVFLAIIIGVAVFTSKSENEHLIMFNVQMDFTLQKIMKDINNIMPVYIFFSITALVITIDLSQSVGFWKLFVIFFLMLLAYYGILLFKLLIAVNK